MTIAELKKMVAENISIDKKRQENKPVILLYEKELKNIILSKEDDDDINMSMPFSAGETIIADSIITERAYKNIYLRDDTTFENVIIKGVNLSDHLIYKCNFYNCIFTDVKLDVKSLKYGYLRNSHFESCFFTDCFFNQNILTDNSFEYCNFKHCDFETCNFKWSCFYKSEIFDTTFNNCMNIEFPTNTKIKATTN